MMTLMSDACWLLEGVSPARSSHDLLAAFIAQEAAGEVALELACGEGLLLETLLTQPAPPSAIIGVDASAEVLAVARRRRQVRRRAVLHCGPAHDLPLPLAEVQAVACHMALQHMDPLPPVLESIARVLCPGGAFGAIACADPVHPLHQRVADLLRASLPPPPSHALTASAAGLRSLLSPHFERIEIDALSLYRTAPPSVLWADLLAIEAGGAHLREGDRASLLAMFLAALVDPAVPVTVVLPVHFVRAWRG